MILEGGDWILIGLLEFALFWLAFALGARWTLYLVSKGEL